MDWDATWLDLAGKNFGISLELRKGALAVREKMENVMRATANGDFEISCVSVLEINGDPSGTV